MGIEFYDYSFKIKNLIHNAGVAFVYEAGNELKDDVQRNSRVDTGQTKGSWVLDVVEQEDEITAAVGSPMENAIWEEFGTGEYAVNGNGRKGGWVYTNRHGEEVWTRGKWPQKTLENAFVKLRNPIIALARQKVQEWLNGH